MEVKTKLSQVPIGASFRVWGREFTKLDNIDGSVLVLQNTIETKMPFCEYEERENEQNNFAHSDIRDWLEGEYIGSLVEEGADTNNDICTSVVDLKCTLGQREYGFAKCKAGLLTLEQYGEYFDIIPHADGSWWLATPWCTPKYSNYGATHALFVSANGNWNCYYCSSSDGVRPALSLNSELLVSWDKLDEEKADSDGELWGDYIKYLALWVLEHKDKSCVGCTPAAFEDVTEWQRFDGQHHTEEDR